MNSLKYQDIKEIQFIKVSTNFMKLLLNNNNETNSNSNKNPFISSNENFGNSINNPFIPSNKFNRNNNPFNILSSLNDINYSKSRSIISTEITINPDNYTNNSLGNFWSINPKILNNIFKNNNRSSPNKITKLYNNKVNKESKTNKEYIRQYLRNILNYKYMKIEPENEFKITNLFLNEVFVFLKRLLFSK